MTDYHDLKQKAGFALKKKGLDGFVARVAKVLDISISMRGLYNSGTVQRLTERLLALGARFDDNNAIDMFGFGVNAHNFGELPESNFTGFIEREVTGTHKLEAGTRYATAMKMIIEEYFPGSISYEEVKTGGRFFGSKERKLKITPPSDFSGDPVFIMFTTDGDNSDKDEATELIVQSSKLPIFWQFVGIGRASFKFLRRLDDMPGRFIDNAGFFQANDIDSIGDEELYERLLSEFPDWLKEAKAKNMY